MIIDSEMMELEDEDETKKEKYLYVLSVHKQTINFLHRGKLLKEF